MGIQRSWLDHPSLPLPTAQAFNSALCKVAAAALPAALTGMGAVQNCKRLYQCRLGLPCLHLFVLLRRKQKHACGTPAHSPPPYRIITARSRYGTIKFPPKKPVSEPKLGCLAISFFLFFLYLSIIIHPLDRVRFGYYTELFRKSSCTFWHHVVLQCSDFFLNTTGSILNYKLF